MFLPSPNRPRDKHYDEFGLYPVNVCIRFKCVCFVGLLKDYFPLFFYQEVVLQVLDYTMGNLLSEGSRIEEAGKLGTLVSQQVSPFFLGTQTTCLPRL